MDKVTYVSRKTMDRYHDKFMRRIVSLNNKHQQVVARLNNFDRRMKIIEEDIFGVLGEAQREEE